MRPTPDPAVLNDEVLAALARAAALAGDPGLAPRLEQLVVAYIRDRDIVGSAPRLGRLHHQLRDDALAAEALRRQLADPWRREAVAGVQALIRIDLDDLDRGLAELARCARVAASAIAPDDRRSAASRPGSPRWTLGWSLAAIWAGTGGYVGTGAASRFHNFAAAVFGAVDEEAPERVLREVADTWRARNGTAEAQKQPVVSFSPGQ